MGKRIPLLLLVVYVLLSNGPVKGQSRRVYQIPKGAIATAVIPRSDQYRYPEFSAANVTYRNGTLPIGKLNYSFLYGEMQFLNEKGDTLALANEENVQSITLGEQFFYYLPGSGFVEIIADLPRVSLGRQATLRIVDRADLYPNTGFHSTAGSAMGVGSGTYLGSAPSFRQLFTQPAPQDFKISREETYLFMDRNKRFYPAQKNTLLQLLPQHRKAIRQYWKAHKPSLKNEHDLITLLTFCNQLGR